MKKRISVDLRGYELDTLEMSSVSDVAMETAAKLRGDKFKNAVMLHGVMPRSGTNYLSLIVALHPNIQPHPFELYEFPFLESSRHLLEFNDKFLSFYARNKEKMGERDLLPVFGSSMIQHLYSGVAEGKRVLTKVPSVRNLGYFRSAFPMENLLLLTRDGRDVVASYQKTFSSQYRWPKPSFAQICMRWKKATDLALAYTEKYSDDPQFFQCRYEDLVANPKEYMQQIGAKFQLDMEIYPYEKIDELAVRGSSAIKPDGKVTWNDQQKPADFNPVGRWSDWSARQKRIFKRVAGDTLLAGGWESNGEW